MIMAWLAAAKCGCCVDHGGGLDDRQCGSMGAQTTTGADSLANNLQGRRILDRRAPELRDDMIDDGATLGFR